MNLFRLCGDLSHLLAIVILLLKIWKSRSVSGVSGKSQLLFAVCFSTRYLDLFIRFVSVYNTFMKVTYLICAWGTCYLIYMKFRSTYDGHHDVFQVLYKKVTKLIRFQPFSKHNDDFFTFLWIWLYPQQF